MTDYTLHSDTLAALAVELNTLAALAAAEGHRLDEVIDTTSLPVFGGPEPDSTDGIYSWDEVGFLVSSNPRTGADEWTVVPRWDLGADDE